MSGACTITLGSPSQGHLALADRVMLTSVRFLEPNSDIFVTGETYQVHGSAQKVSWLV